MQPRLFLSHPWVANTHHFALRLVDALRARGYEVWIDEQQMLPGQHIQQRQRTGIESETDIFVFTLSQASLASPNCMRELRTAAAAGKPIITIQLEPMPAPLELTHRICVDFTNPVYFEASVDRLSQGCEALQRTLVVIHSLGDDDPEVRSEAARLLRDMNASDGVQALVAVAAKERDHAVLYWLLLAVGHLAALRPDLTPEVLNLLEYHARGNSAIPRRGAIEGLAALREARLDGDIS